MSERSGKFISTEPPTSSSSAAAPGRQGSWSASSLSRVRLRPSRTSAASATSRAWRWRSRRILAMSFFRVVGSHLQSPSGRRFFGTAARLDEIERKARAFRCITLWPSLAVSRLVRTDKVRLHRLPSRFRKRSCSPNQATLAAMCFQPATPAGVALLPSPRSTAARTG